MTDEAEWITYKGSKMHRAVGNARNPGESKYGHALYRLNATSNSRFSDELRTIEKQLRRSNMHVDQEKRQFLQRRSSLTPMLIVERPASPQALRKYRDTQYDEANYHSHDHPHEGPRYMKPIKSKPTSINLRPSIDAFCLKTKKKVNTWESVILEKEKPSFRCTVMPSWPLTKHDIDDLVCEMEHHTGGNNGDGPPAKCIGLLDVPVKKKKKKKSQTPKQVQFTSPRSSETDLRNEMSSSESGSGWRFVTEIGQQSRRTSTSMDVSAVTTKEDSCQEVLSDRTSRDEEERFANGLSPGRRKSLRRNSRIKLKEIKRVKPEVHIYNNRPNAILVYHDSVDNDEGNKSNSENSDKQTDSPDSSIPNTPKEQKRAKTNSPDGRTLPKEHKRKTNSPEGQKSPVTKDKNKKPDQNETSDSPTSLPSSPENERSNGNTSEASDIVSDEIGAKSGHSAKSKCLVSSETRESKLARQETALSVILEAAMEGIIE